MSVFLNSPRTVILFVFIDDMEKSSLGSVEHNPCHTSLLA